MHSTDLDMFVGELTEAAEADEAAEE